MTQPISRAIEDDGFPFEVVSEIAEAESWRKEIYRPIYHVHKWWAQRLGSVFRAAILGAARGNGIPLMKSFYQPTDLGGLVVFDPFMGSGTTVGEAAKLGCAAVGRDINPVAYNSVRVTLGPLDRYELDEAFRTVEKAVRADLLDLYRSVDSRGRPCDVLYFFWVKVVACPKCSQMVDLFPSFLFARHAYVKRYPTVHAVCPDCGAIVKGSYQDQRIACESCHVTFDLHRGPARGAKAVCRSCHHEFVIAPAIRSTGRPPEHRLFAKLVLNKEGSKEYIRTTPSDDQAYERVAQKLTRLDLVKPSGELADGHNTKQALNYNYHRWSDFFNARQLVALGLLAKSIDELPSGSARDALALVFSGTLEFNNLFASYKGEGTGAVRHMFSHHILKPERMPIEANVWGLPQSSGAFSNLYRTRLLRALEYREAPFEVAAERVGDRVRGKKVFGSNASLAGLHTHKWTPRPGKAGIYLSCGDSGSTGLADNSVDLVITDPPFFDNVHYSELADFFHAWQRTLLPVSTPLRTTRQNGEVQDRNAASFADKLARVFGECFRVLADDGLLVFSYHHSREDGWSSLARAICDAGFNVVQAHPVKAEMAVAAPKTQAIEPIDIDMLMVCRKRALDRRSKKTLRAAIEAAHDRTQSCLARFATHGRRFSRNDVKVLLLSTLLRELSPGRTSRELDLALTEVASETALLIDTLRQGARPSAPLPRSDQQLSLAF